RQQAGVELKQTSKFSTAGLTPSCRRRLGLRQSHTIWLPKPHLPVGGLHGAHQGADCQRKPSSHPDSRQGR
ncbi:MAG: hypothetical protein OER56_12305, partial [Hyphomicrobiales bacterium]|nr:hypothetical protein [Hyphomicrobiales bacterium]